MKKVLFIDRDGTLLIEPPIDSQVDRLDKVKFYPGALRWLSQIAEELDYELVMVTNQDGLGTSSFPEEHFWPAQNLVVETFKGVGVEFSEILIDKSFPDDNAPTRKPETGMLQRYIYGDYDLKESYVIGDRMTDVKLATNLGAKAIYISEKATTEAELSTTSWKDIYQYLKQKPRTASLERVTSETQVKVQLNLDGSGKTDVSTGLSFFDHMLDQIVKHAQLDLFIACNGDLEVDEHHTMEDVALALGECFKKALGDKKGIQRYGFLLPMDDCLAQVAIDMGGRPWLVWEVHFHREMIGQVPTEMFMHFFKSFSDAAKWNINISAQGDNEHHKIESIFKGFAKALLQAKKKDESNLIPSTKGTL